MAAYQYILLYSVGGGGGGVGLSLVWISKAVVSRIEEETMLLSVFYYNRPFYRYWGHIELIRFKEYYRMPRGHEHISFVFSSAFRDIFS